MSSTLLHLTLFLYLVAIAVQSEDNFTPLDPHQNPFRETDAEVEKRQAQGCGYATCADCTRNDYCGWCKSTGGCLQGTAAGPTYTAYCSIQNWQYYTCTDCHSYYSCDTCSAITASSTTAKGACVWCESSYSCVEANPTYGARTADCSDDTTLDWSGCCNDPYSSDNCKVCTKKGCGYCEDDQLCKRGSSSGPASGYTCDNVTANWKFGTTGPGACPPPTTGCGSHVTGDTCVADSNCGFCDGECVDGDFYGPSSGYCTTYDYGGYCSPHQDQTSCTAVLNCGWCGLAPGYGTCFSGSNTGPYNGFPNCQPWVPNPNNTPPPPPPATTGGGGGTDVGPTSNDPCSAHTDGDTCTSYHNCVWCTSQSGTSSNCVSGSSSGPDSGLGPNCGLYDYGSYCDPYQGSDSTPCLGHGGCGWCVAPGYGAFCLSGTSSGPYLGVPCGSWQYSTVPPPPPADTGVNPGSNTNTAAITNNCTGNCDNDSDSESENTDGASTTAVSTTLTGLAGLCLLAVHN